jgi:hypothetical protein
LRRRNHASSHRGGVWGREQWQVRLLPLPAQHPPPKVSPAAVRKPSNLCPNSSPVSLVTLHYIVVWFGVSSSSGEGGFSSSCLKSLGLKSTKICAILSSCQMCSVCGYYCTTAAATGLLCSPVPSYLYEKSSTTRIVIVLIDH